MTIKCKPFWTMVILALLPILCGFNVEDPPLVDPPNKKVQTDPSIGTRTAIMVELHGVIDPISGGVLLRKFSDALSQRPEIIVIDIDSPGGYLGTTMQLVEMLERASEVETVAFITHEAISGAALTALAADKIILHSHARIGDAGLIVEGEDSAFRYAPEKARSHLVQQVRTIATKSGRPPALAEAMVDKDISVIRAIQIDTKEARFFTSPEWETLKNRDRWKKDETVVEAKKGTFLTLNGQRAVELGLADANVESTEDLEKYLNLEKPIVTLRTSTVDTVMLILNHPLVTGLMLFVGLGALLFELTAPGIGFGGILSILCFGLFFWSRFLGGTAGWLEAVLFLMGLIFIGMEIFLIPGFGIAGLGGIGMVILALVMASRHVLVPESGRDLTQFGVTFGTVILAFFAFLVFTLFLGPNLEQIPGLSRLALSPPSDTAALTSIATLTAKKVELPAWDRLAIGDCGTSLTALRPSGKAQFADVVVDVVTEGDYVDSGFAVEVYRKEGTRVIVRRAKA